MRISSEQLKRLLQEYQAQLPPKPGAAGAERAGRTQQDRAASSPAAGGSGPTPAGEHDSVDFSPVAQELLRARASSDPARARQIESIRRRIEAGTYQVPGEEVAKAWLRRLVADQLAGRLGSSPSTSGGTEAPRPDPGSRP